MEKWTLRFETTAYCSRRLPGRLAFAGLVALALVSGACRERGTEGPRDPANEIPLGHVDQPADKSQTAYQTPVGGWALDDKGIQEVRIYVDGHFAVSTPLNTPRPDVSKAFPNYANGTHLHGWSTVVVFEAPGPHTILAQAVDTSGATRDLGIVSVTSTDK